jgi:hypothetical protein
MPILQYQTLRFYDPQLDAEAIRISGFSGRGEFWMKQPFAPAGRKRREQLAEALELIEEAIDAKRPDGQWMFLPGEVMAA